MLVWFGLLAALAWCVAALRLMVDSIWLTQHTRALRERQRVALRMRVTNSVLLVCLTLMLLAGGLSFGDYDRFPFMRSIPLKPLLAIFGLGYLVLVVITLLFRELPGRRLLRRAENVGAILIAMALAALGVIAVRQISWQLVHNYAVGALLLALMFGFFLAGRGYLRGALVVAEHIVGHGTHPTREATLKRLMRRFRPFVAGSLCAVLLAIPLMQ
ncbi:MAG: hypothetical protein AAF290_09505 [Pseudomonadota bacterium]